MIEKYGLDQFKYFLLREVTLGQDGDFSEFSFKARINSELSNNLGNLIQRTLKFIGKNFENKMPLDLEGLSENNLLNEVYDLFSKVKKHMHSLEINKAIDEIISLLTKLNKFMDLSRTLGIQ